MISLDSVLSVAYLCVPHVFLGGLEGLFRAIAVLLLLELGAVRLKLVARLVVFGLGLVALGVGLFAIGNEFLVKGIVLRRIGK